MRTIIWFIYFGTYLLFLIPGTFKAQKAEKAGDIALRDALLKKHVVPWARRLIKLAGVTVSVEGLENIPQCAVVYAGNHQGNFDIPTLLASLPAPYGFISKDAVEKLPVIRDWMRLLGCVFIDRDNMRQSVTALGVAAKSVKEDGRSIIIFPEGTRSRGGSLNEFKNGAFRIATKSKAPIVPFCIEGSYKAMEANGNWIKPAHIVLSIMPPIYTHEMSREEQNNLGEILKERIEVEIKRIQAKDE